MSTKTEDKLYEQVVRQLPASARRRLAKRIMADLPSDPDKGGTERRYDWLDLEGIAPDLLGGEDAQQWVSRTRRQGTERRREQWEAGR
jgi:hypothetical protein